MLLMDRNKDLLDRLTILKDDRVRLLETLQRLAEESEGEVGRRI